jgi:hypothetical protein
VSEQQDPRPVGEWDVDEAAEPAPSPPDNARADDIAHNHAELDEEPNV